MDRRVVAGEERLSLFQASPASSYSAGRDGGFAAQALRGSLNNVRRVEALLEPTSAEEILRKELLKHRIRQEIIAREMPEMRLLEEEVRRELEMERALAMRRFMEITFSSAGGVPVHAEGRAPVALQFGAGDDVERTKAGVGTVRGRPFGGRLEGKRLLPDVGNGRLAEKLMLPRSDLENKSSVSTSAHSASPSEENAAGIKRKASTFPGLAQNTAAELPAWAKRVWSCALCQVGTNSREVLNGHLQGRKHRAKQALLGITKKAEGSTSTTRGPEALLGITKKAEGSTSTTRGPVKSSTLAKGAVPKNSPVNPKDEGVSPAKKQKTGTSLWCELCKLECTSDKTLASHLGGKKHRTRLEAVHRKKGAATTAATEESSGCGAE